MPMKCTVYRQVISALSPSYPVCIEFLAIGSHTCSFAANWRQEGKHMTSLQITLIVRTSVVLASTLLAAGRGDAGILGTTASVRPDNSFFVDVQVTTDSNASHVAVTYQATGVDPLVSRMTQVSSSGSTTITV